MKFETMRYIEPELLDKLINLADRIAQFKTLEMEAAFADMLRKINNPPIFLKEQS